jgi:hypothetical protein
MYSLRSESQNLNLSVVMPRFRRGIQ